MYVRPELNHQSHLIPELPISSSQVFRGCSTESKNISDLKMSVAEHPMLQILLPAPKYLLVPCTDRRYFVLLTGMPLLYCVMYTQGGCRVTKLWNYVRNLVVHWYLWVVWALKQLTYCSEQNQSLVCQINLISSLSSTKDFNGVKRVEEIWQRQEVSKLIAAAVYEDTKHFLPWLAYPV